MLTAIVDNIHYSAYCKLYNWGCLQVMKNAIKGMEENMSEESVRRARLKAEQEIFAIRLFQLREEQGVKQSDMRNFNQSSVSKIEKRKDMKISTLLDYLDSLNLDLEIAVYPREDYSDDSRRVLLRF